MQNHKTPLSQNKDKILKQLYYLHMYNANWKHANDVVEFFLKKSHIN